MSDRTAVSCPQPCPTGTACPCEFHTEQLGSEAQVEAPSFEAWYARQVAWSRETFGPDRRTAGVLAHIRKEIAEVEADPHDLAEWLDIATLALDGYWRHGGTVEGLLPALQAKQDRNFAREWPDWRTLPQDVPVEHVRSLKQECYACKGACVIRTWLGVSTCSRCHGKGELR